MRIDIYKFVRFFQGDENRHNGELLLTIKSTVVPRKGEKVTLDITDMKEYVVEDVIYALSKYGKHVVALHVKEIV